jgi:phage tail tape-measure protein
MRRVNLFSRIRHNPLAGLVAAIFRESPGCAAAQPVAGACLTTRFCLPLGGGKGVYMANRSKKRPAKGRAKNGPRAVKRTRAKAEK